MSLKKYGSYFSTAEKLLWCISVLLILISFILFDRENYLILSASMIGATSLIFNAKGNPIGQLLMILFSVIYSVVSFTFSYYGEMVTYLGMTAPMSGSALVSWIKNPYGGNKAEVKINSLKKREIFFMTVLGAAVTIAFYYILNNLGTANIIFSTISVTTSFFAAYLTFRRSAYFALAYAANDIVLLVLWTMAAISDPTYISVIICFSVFLFNDIYGFINWKSIKRRQSDN